MLRVSVLELLLLLLVLGGSGMFSFFAGMRDARRGKSRWQTPLLICLTVAVAIGILNFVLLWLATFSQSAGGSNPWFRWIAPLLATAVVFVLGLIPSLLGYLIGKAIVSTPASPTIGSDVAGSVPDETRNPYQPPA